MSDNPTVECIECGDDIPESDATYGQGTPTDALKSAANGETLTADEAFAFDDGPYCNFECLMASDSNE